MNLNLNNHKKDPYRSLSNDRDCIGLRSRKLKPKHLKILSSKGIETKASTEIVKLTSFRLSIPPTVFILLASLEGS